MRSDQRRLVVQSGRNSSKPLVFRAHAVTLSRRTFTYRANQQRFRSLIGDTISVLQSAPPRGPLGPTVRGKSTGSRRGSPKVGPRTSGFKTTIANLRQLDPGSRVRWLARRMPLLGISMFRKWAMFICGYRHQCPHGGQLWSRRYGADSLIGWKSVDRDGFCKHCVAVGLAWLEQGKETPYPKKRGKPAATING